MPNSIIHREHVFCKSMGIGHFNLEFQILHFPVLCIILLYNYRGFLALYHLPFRMQLKQVNSSDIHYSLHNKYSPYI